MCVDIKSNWWCHLLLNGGNFFVPLNRSFCKFCFSHCAEPVGLKAPSLSNDATSISYTRMVGQGFGLLCQAQAFPAPYFRYVR